MSTMSPLNDAPKPRIPDAIDKQRLQAMQLVAKMKESADKYGVGFVGGFVSPDGQKFMMTNMNEDDTNALLPEDLKWNKLFTKKSLRLMERYTQLAPVITPNPSMT